MIKAILGKKIGMTQIFDDKGQALAVTVVEAGPCYVTQVKGKEKDGYDAIQFGLEETRKISKPKSGHLKLVKKNLKYLKEFRMDLDNIDHSAQDAEKTEPKIELPKVGDKIDVSVFSEGDSVKVSGTSKGKGFAGVIKRHNFSRGPMSHGSRHHRKPGSIGSMYPQRVRKGRKMPGRMGAEKTTVSNLRIVEVHPEKNVIVISGAIPGPNKGLITIIGA